MQVLSLEVVLVELEVSLRVSKFRRRNGRRNLWLQNLKGDISRSVSWISTKIEPCLIHTKAGTGFKFGCNPTAVGLRRALCGDGGASDDGGARDDRLVLEETPGDTRRP